MCNNAIKRKMDIILREKGDPGKVYKKTQLNFRSITTMRTETERREEWGAVA